MHKTTVALILRELLSLTEYFSGYDIGIASLRIDSIANEGMDTIYFPMKNMRAYDNNCFTPYGPSWIGKKIVIQPDGTYLFFNYRSDTLVIRPQARLGEIWQVFRDEHLIIEAKLNSIKQETFFGITDSVKTFIFSAYNTGHQSVSNPIAEMQLWISKENGILKTPNFYFYPDFKDELSGEGFQEYELAGLTNPEIGKQNITLKMVHDYDIGNEIHTNYYYRAFTPTSNKILTIRKILGKESRGDTIRYLVDLQRYQNKLDEGNVIIDVYTHDTIAQDYSTVDTLFDKLPGEVIIDEGYAHTPIIKGDTKYLSSDYGDITSYYSQDSCWQLPITDGCFGYDKYINGLGGPYYYCYYFASGLEIKNNLVYYKKGDTEWGTPLNLLPYSIEKNISNKQLKVYPNPASESLTIELLNSPGEVSYTIYTSLGKIVKEAGKLSNSEININISNFPKGAYYLEVVNGEGEKYTQIFMKK